jgi:signal transduction histidine kinase/AraC-like DNA-binding protein/CheY-like chemotaxis protein/ABC-type xylose transport system substrate-binding protein
MFYKLRRILKEYAKNSFRAYLKLAVITLLLSGCGHHSDDKEYVIGFSQCVGSDLWRKTMLDEVKMELSLHPGARLIYADAGGNSKTQVVQVQDMLDQNIDLLIISPNEAQPLTPIVDRVYNKGIPVIVIDRKTSSDLYTAYVGADNYEIGRMAGQYLATTLKGKGNIIEIMGLPGSSPTIERHRGFNDAIRNFPGIRITGQAYGNWFKENAETQLLKIQPALGKANAVFAHNDVMASGARQVIEQLVLNQAVKVVGIDALPGNGGGLQMVASAKLTASMLYPTGGKEAILTAFNILNKHAFTKENILPSLVIDSSNVQLMKLQWNKVSSQQKDIERQQALLKEQKEIYDNQQLVLNVTVITLVLAVVFGGLAFYSLLENRKINKSLELKNLEILDQRNQLIEMSAKAEVATEAKLNFFTNISHEFRTPLTLILSPLEDLMRQEKVKSVAGKNLKLIHKNVFRLLRLVNQLIEYRKIEYEKLQVRVSAHNLYEFINEIAESFQHNSGKRNIDLRLICSDHQLSAWFDENMLDKVLFNLLSNALKFTSDNGRIHVHVKQDDERIFVLVEDNGIGISEHDAVHVFDHFYQADTNSTKGSGLGLSLSKELMRLHHGDIEVSSKKWQGTTFKVTLLKGNEHFNAEEIRKEERKDNQLYERARIYTTDLDEPAEIKQADIFGSLKEHTLLIVEDNIDLLRYLEEKFAETFEVFTAANGTEGLGAAYDQVPDLIISDVVLPGMSGKDLAQALKSDIRTSHIPIILLTAKGSVEQQITGMESMADIYMVKPFNFDYLLASVKNLIGNRLLLKSHYTSDISVTGKVPVSKTLDKKFINDFSGIVEQNLANENFSVDDICKTIGVSRVQLYRKVKALLGCSITDYILNRRLKKAKFMLMNEDHSISEITYMVGFSTPNYFATVFKAKYGCTPSDFKRNQSC